MMTKNGTDEHITASGAPLPTGGIEAITTSHYDTAPQLYSEEEKSLSGFTILSELIGIKGRILSKYQWRALEWPPRSSPLASTKFSTKFWSYFDISLETRTKQSKLWGTRNKQKSGFLPNIEKTTPGWNSFLLTTHHCPKRSYLNSPYSWGRHIISRKIHLELFCLLLARDR